MDGNGFKVKNENECFLLCTHDVVKTDLKFGLSKDKGNVIENVNPN